MAIKEWAKRIVPPSTRMVDRRVELLQSESRVLLERIDRLEAEVHALANALERSAEQVMRLRAASLAGELAERALRPLVGNPGLVVSVASYGARISDIAPMIESLGAQSVRPDRAFLWLPVEDFPRGLADVPAPVVCACHDAGVELRWADENLGPHNKYFWAMRAFPESLFVTLDDDVRYPRDLLADLLEAHGRWPNEVIAMRTNLIVSDEGGLRPYADWQIEQSEVVDAPSSRLLATGSGGILYPPGCLDGHVFDAGAIRRTCLHADDLWLKVMEALAGTNVVCPSRGFALDGIEGTQEVALWRTNLDQGGNDAQLSSILDWVASFADVEDVLGSMMGLSEACPYEPEKRNTEVDEG